MKIFEDHEGNTSSFRVIWAITVLIVLITWSYMSITTMIMQPWPADALTSIGILVSPALKTFTERANSVKKDDKT